MPTFFTLMLDSHYFPALEVCFPKSCGIIMVLKSSQRTLISSFIVPKNTGWKFQKVICLERALWKQSLLLVKNKSRNPHFCVIVVMSKCSGTCVTQKLRGLSKWRHSHKPRDFLSLLMTQISESLWNSQNLCHAQLLCCKVCIATVFG